jgi:transposase-like protein
MYGAAQDRRVDDFFMTKKSTKTEPAKRGKGRPQAEFTERERRIVKTLLSVGEPVGRVAKIVGIDENTLRKHFPEEIKSAFSDTYSQVAVNFLQRVLTDESPTAAIFWLKTRAKWSEQPEMQEGGPPPIFYTAPLREGEDLQKWLAEAREKAEKAKG